MSSTLHSGSGDNRGPIVTTRGELAAHLAALTADRAAALSASVDHFVGWQPMTTGTQPDQRRADVRRAAERLGEIDAEIANTTAQIAATDELLAAFDTAIA